MRARTRVSITTDRIHFWSQARSLMSIGLAALAVTTAILLGIEAANAQNNEEDVFETALEAVAPRSFSAGSQIAPKLSQTERADLFRRHLERQEAVAAKANNNVQGPPGLPERFVEETKGAVEREFHGDPNTLVIAGNAINTVVPISPSFRSSLGEPAVGNLGREVFYTGNTFASFSVNEGSTWTDRAFPDPLITGESVCCDQDVEVDQGRHRVLWSLLYTNSSGTHGVVTIAVLTSPSSAPSCLYDFDLGTNRLPDYPHIGLSNNFLYLNTNQIDTKGTATIDDDTWVNSQMRRITLDPLVDCQTVTIETFTYGPPTFTSQRVFVPVEGANDVMYWGVLDNTTTFRIFEWRETSTSVTSTTRTITTSPHNNPDCSGGANNTDFIERNTAFDMTGFRMRGWYGQPEKGGGRDVVGFLWNVGTDSSHPQGHIHSAVFDADTKNLLTEPHIWNSDFCFGYPDVAVTKRGHPAIILAFGGRSGGRGPAVSNGVLLGDDLALGTGPFGNFTTIASGTHNPADERYGDYFTIQQHEPCDLFMVASGYALVNGTAGANTEHHYVQFGRGRDRPCWDFRHAAP